MQTRKSMYSYRISDRLLSLFSDIDLSIKEIGIGRVSYYGI